MSAYTIGEVAVSLLIAAGLGFALGWLARELALRARPARSASSAPRVTEATPAAEAAPVTEATPVTDAAPSQIPDEASELPIFIAPGPHPGSALPKPDGSAPSADHIIKVSRGSKIYHSPSSPAYDRTRAAIWFTGPEAAEDAGFRRPKNG